MPDTPPALVSSLSDWLVTVLESLRPGFESDLGWIGRRVLGAVWGSLIARVPVLAGAAFAFLMTRWGDTTARQMIAYLDHAQKLKASLPPDEG